MIIIGAALFFYSSGTNLSNLPFMPQQIEFRTLDINGAKLKVELADTQAKRSKGLGDRQSLGPNEGMLFIFPKSGKTPFWMKGLTFPLDFVWIRDDKVVDILQNALPPAPNQPDSTLPIYEPKVDADKVLEVNAGTVQRLNVKVGDTIKVE